MSYYENEYGAGSVFEEFAALRTACSETIATSSSRPLLQQVSSQNLTIVLSEDCICFTSRNQNSQDKINYVV